MKTVMKSMRKKHRIRRLTAGALAFLMIAALFAAWPITVSAAGADQHTVSASEIRNDYLRVFLNDERHVLFTTGGDPNSASDNNQKLLFDCTSRAFINVNGRITTFSPVESKKTPEGNSLYSYTVTNGIKIERYISFAYNIYTSRYDTVEYKYVMTNTSGTSAEVGTRLFFDTMLGNNDSAPFRVNGLNLTQGTEFVGDDIPQSWQVFDNLANPSVVASGTFYYNESDRPDRVQFLNYQRGSQTTWDCSYSGSIGDSSVNVYFNPIPLEPGESRTVKTYYGLSAFVPNEEPDETEPEETDPDETDPEPDPVADLDFSAIVPSELIINEERDGYVGNPFAFNGWVNNTGDLPLNNVQMTIELPAGLTLLSDPTVFFNNIPVGGDGGVVWRIRAESAATNVTYRYTVTVSADGLEPESYTYSLAVPQLVHRHTYVESENQAPSCNRPGFSRYECSECGDRTETYIPPIQHNYRSEIVAEATCTTPGMVQYTCIHCADSYMTYIYAEHSFELVEHQPARCTQDGFKRFQCVTCSDSYVENIPGGHSYEATVTRVATETEEGLITYTCSICGDVYTEIIPVRQAASILLIQDRLPWTENINTILLDRLLADGYIVGWDMITTRELAGIELSMYDVIYIANDQSTDTYNRLRSSAEKISSFAEDGGVVIYGACDQGWAAGDISYALPGGVTIENYYSNRNYIANPNHYIVTGALTDRKPITNELLYSTYSSHTYFTNLPADAISILEDANGHPTLVEYAVGDGYVIASGLTWEYTYVRDFVNGTSFAQNVYDDLLVYAMTLSDPCEHVYDEGIVVAPTCDEDGYTLHTCLNCGRGMKDSIVEATGHVEGEWTLVREATEHQPGLKELRCLACHEVLAEEVIPVINGPVIQIIALTDHVLVGEEITFLIQVENCGLVNSLAIVPEFDSNIFELVNVSWEIEALLQDIEAGTLRSVSAWREPTDINTTVYSITLLAKAPTAVTTVGCTFTVQDGNGVSTYPVVAKTLSVSSCPHTHKRMEPVNDTHHASVCTRCGYSEIMAHEFDYVCDSTCDVCGYEREVTHDYADGWSVDYREHWHACSVCGDRKDVHEHEYDAPCDNTCNVCSYVRIGFELVIGVGDYANVRSGAIQLLYDQDVLEIAEAQWLLNDVMMSDFSTADGRGVFLLRESQSLAGAVLRLLIVVKDTEHYEDAMNRVAAQLILEYADYTEETVNLNAGNILVMAPLYHHVFTDEIPNDQYLATEATCTARATYYYSCQYCHVAGSETFAYGEVLPHEYDSVCDDDCNRCGEVREAPHQYYAVWEFDDTCHWRLCELCGAHSAFELHFYEDDYDMQCEGCLYERYTAGDANQNGILDPDDALYVVYHVLFGADLYPSEQPFDYDGNGAVNSDDAVHLLYSFMFGEEEYPLNIHR